MAFSISGTSVISNTRVGSFGTGTATGVITSSIATGTAPLSVASTTLCTNLNVSALRGNAGSYYKDIVAATRMLFVLASAPTGWTQDTTSSLDNRMIRVVDSAGNGTGGSDSPILMNVVPAHTHSITTGNNSASHSHDVSITSSGISGNHYHNSVVLGGGTVYDWVGGSTSVGATSSSGGVSANHQHSISTTTGGISATHTHSGSTDDGSSQTNWTPKYINAIVCSRDV